MRKTHRQRLEASIAVGRAKLVVWNEIMKIRGRARQDRARTAFADLMAALEPRAQWASTTTTTMKRCPHVAREFDAEEAAR